MIEVSHLTKRYGPNTALQDVSFAVEGSGVVGFLGPNGAGKSTTMNIVTGYLSATSGTVVVEGHDVLEDADEAKSSIGYLPELPPLYMDMTVDEYLRFCCDIKGVARKYVTKHLNDICELTGLGEVRKRLIKNLSKGYKQRVGLAQALVGNPEVVILDEPTVGLDPKQIIEIRRLIRDLGEDHTVVLSSHILPEVADVCERLVIINNGQIVAQDTLENLTHGIGETYRMTLRVKGPEKEVRQIIRDIDGTRYCECIGTKEPDTFDFLVESDRKTDIRPALFTRMAKQDMPIMMMKPMDMTLEDIFLQLTQDSDQAQQ